MRNILHTKFNFLRDAVYPAYRFNLPDTQKFLKGKKMASPGEIRRKRASVSPATAAHFHHFLSDANNCCLFVCFSSSSQVTVPLAVFSSWVFTLWFLYLWTMIQCMCVCVRACVCGKKGRKKEERGRGGAIARGRQSKEMSVIKAAGASGARAHDDRSAAGSCSATLSPGTASW